MPFHPELPAVLEQFSMDSEQIHRLASNQRTRLLHFLLRWNHLDVLQRALDTLVAAHPYRVSFLDLYAQLHLANGHPEQALSLMERRLSIKSSSTAQALLARVHLACGNHIAAEQIAQDLIRQQQDSTMAWNLLGEVELARGHREGALAAYRTAGKLSPASQQYLLGMVALYEADSDFVSASAYAVQLLQSPTNERQLSAGALQRLHDYFRRSGDAARVADLNEQLATLYEAELADVQTSVNLGSTHISEPIETNEPDAQISVPAPTASIHVSEEERDAIENAVKRTFGFESLLPGQMETIACALRGEDVLTILPTGGGKSLCYQLPAFLDSKGATLVISPLIALMKDQIDSLPAGLRGRAATINSSLDGDELRWQQEQLANGAYRLVYAAPERLRQPAFLHALRCAGVSRLVVDEAHCVSAWGHDFRPDYLTIAQARDALGNPPVLAMTATAPERVRRDILRHITMTEEGREDRVHVIVGDAIRPNLHLEVFHARSANDKLRHLLAFCRSETGSGIIYAGTRARCEELAALLRRYGVEAGHYHAGIQDRAAVQDAFMDGRVRVVVATVAFGLGIDKPDIRFIVHYAPPPSVEAYYQEAGRAGRDGQPARCLLMWSSADRGTLTRRMKMDAMPVDFLRRVYTVIKRRLGAAKWGHVAMADIGRDVTADDTRVRVAISLLEEVGLLRRGPDLPRSASISLCGGIPEGALPESLLRIRQHYHLRPDQWLTIDLGEAARRADVPPAEIETRILQWADQGWLGYRSAGRDILIELLPNPQDIGDRINALLERNAAIQASRADDIFAYAQTGRCRHGYLSAHLGSRKLARCTACDNCVGTTKLADPDLPDERQQLVLALECLAASDWGWGRSTLTGILKGEGKRSRDGQPLHSAALGNPRFGALALCSKTAIQQMLDGLKGAGFLAPRSIENGGEVLELTPRGRRALHDHSELDTLVQSSTPHQAPAPVQQSQGNGEVDEGLVEALRRWRLEEARSQNVPPYVILHDSHLRSVAALRPTTLEALAEVKGFGSKRLERYGAAVIQMVTQHAAGETD